jgi:predicted CopG family antitoxin
MVDTTIPIDSDVRDRLRAQKEGNETYSDVIARLIDHRLANAEPSGQPADAGDISDTLTDE